MKNKAKDINKRVTKELNKITNEKGAIIVEASIVFPVMFFVLLFIIFIGNIYYEQAKVDEIVLKYAVKGAECVADPFLYDISSGGGVPKKMSDVKDIEPYRYILGSITDGSVSAIEDKISQDIKDEINDTSLVFFGNSKANILGSDNDKIATFNNYVIYSTFVVQVNYEIKMPIAFLGDDYPTVVKMSSRAEVPVSDAPEFIRNVDMAVDILEGTKAGDAIKKIFTKAGEFINKFS